MTCELLSPVTPSDSCPMEDGPVRADRYKSMAKVSMKLFVSQAKADKDFSGVTERVGTITPMSMGVTCKIPEHRGEKFLKDIIPSGSSGPRSFTICTASSCGRGINTFHRFLQWCR
ncbi:hypothetical protein STEG23_006093 [Scotinomys teguina]